MRHKVCRADYFHLIYIYLNNEIHSIQQIYFNVKFNGMKNYLETLIWPH